MRLGKPMPERTLLLDTHVWIWYVTGNSELKSTEIRDAIESAIKSSRLFISSITLWETAMLVSKRRITLSIDTLDWMHTGLRDAGIQTMEITPEIAAESANLGEAFHGDPADRIIVATARIRNCCIVTRDARILSYSREGFCRALAA
jgi:PIN domain nuclease of toxin-antitoxin system